MRGQALVEFALAVPIFFLVIFGLIDLGRAVYVNNSISEAARDGTRWGSVQARSSTAADRSEVADYVQTRLVGVPGAVVTVTCDSALPTFCSADSILTVKVETELDMITPIIAQLLGAAGINPLDLEAESRVQVNS